MTKAIAKQHDDHDDDDDGDDDDYDYDHNNHVDAADPGHGEEDSFYEKL